MEFYKLILIILIVFLKTGNVLSKESIFNVNNIKLEKKANLSNKKLADQAIRKGFGELAKKILLDEDIKQLSELKLSQIKELVSYYQVVNFFVIQDFGFFLKKQYSFPQKKKAK